MSYVEGLLVMPGVILMMHHPKVRVDEDPVHPNTLSNWEMHNVNSTESSST